MRKEAVEVVSSGTSQNEVGNGYYILPGGLFQATSEMNAISDLREKKLFKLGSKFPVDLGGC
jgi:hypothetical protein